MTVLPDLLTEVPRYRWCERKQMFLAELTADGHVVQVYAIPADVYFRIQAEMAVAVEAFRAAQVKQAAVVALKPRRRRKRH